MKQSLQERRPQNIKTRVQEKMTPKQREVKHKLTKLRERREGKQKDCRIKMSRKSTSRMITVAISSHLRGKVEMRKEIKQMKR